MRGWGTAKQIAKRIRSLHAASRRPEVRERRRLAALNRPPASKSLCEIRSKKAKERWSRPEFKKRMIKIFKRAHDNPATREKHRVLANGQFGKNTSLFVKTLGKILMPLGYIPEFPVRNKYKTWKGGYCVDFGLPSAKIAIECDGPRHRVQRQIVKDQKKDKILKSLGWKVIRVPHD
jgi:Protein of unknown function (DUF559)